MKINKKVDISIILVIIWMIVIFKFSAMSSDESNKKSKGIIGKVVEKVETNIEETINKENSNISEANNIDTQKILTTNKTNNSKNSKIVNKLNKPFRKFAHASVYFVLSIFIVILLLQIKKKLKLKYYLISIGLCFLYACTDEYHQLFVDGRTGQFTDVLIDTLGAILGCLIFFLIYKLKHKISNKVEEKIS